MRMQLRSVAVAGPAAELHNAGPALLVCSCYGPGSMPRGAYLRITAGTQSSNGRAPHRACMHACVRACVRCRPCQKVDGNAKHDQVAGVTVGTGTIPTGLYHTPAVGMYDWAASSAESGRNLNGTLGPLRSLWLCTCTGSG